MHVLSYMRAEEYYMRDVLKTVTGSTAPGGGPGWVSGTNVSIKIAAH